MHKKLAVIYNVWDGEELINHSINAIKKFAHKIIVVWSEMSSYGELYKPDLPFEDSDYDFVFFPVKKIFSQRDAQLTELNKRRMGLHLAKMLGCDYFLLSDCDEVYDPILFEFYFKQIIENDYDSSACKMFTYYKYPNWQLEPIEDYYVPFIHKLTPSTNLKLNSNYKLLIDPTRGVADKKKMLKIDKPIMHHFSFVRKNLERKLNNSKSKKSFDIKKIIEKFNNDEVSFFSDKKIKIVENKFGIKI